MGLLIGQLLAAMGASEVAIVDPLRSRLEVAATLGLGPCASSADQLAESFAVAVDATGVQKPSKRPSMQSIGVGPYLSSVSPT